jgi:tetratricopeptide repeat protein
MTRTILFYLLLISIFVSGTSAQTSVGVTTEMRVEANGYYQAGEWPRAIFAYQKISYLEPANVQARYRLGMSLMNSGKAMEAVSHLEKVMSSSPNNVFALSLARVYARTNNKAKAFAALEKGIQFGGASSDMLLAEKDFAPWRDDAAFKEIVRKSDVAANPCKARDEFRQFDFWIGEWDVRTPQGLPAGSSSVQLILGQCIIFENWSGGGGTNGKSFNIFDSTDNKWHQTWVDDKGTFTHYVGGLQGGSMVVVSDTTVSGKKALAKMTFTKLENGDVRQHGENSVDEGKTWTTTFDLIYSRKKI